MKLLSSFTRFSQIVNKMSRNWLEVNNNFIWKVRIKWKIYLIWIIVDGPTKKPDNAKKHIENICAQMTILNIDQPIKIKTDDQTRIECVLNKQKKKTNDNYNKCTYYIQFILILESLNHSQMAGTEN